MKVRFCVGIKAGNMIQVSGEATLPRAGCVCGTLVNRAPVQRSTHPKVIAHLSFHNTFFFFCQPGGRHQLKTSAETAVRGQERRFAPSSSRCHILHLQSKESRRPGLPDCRPVTQTAAAAPSSQTLRAANLIGVLKMKRKEEFTAAAYSWQTARSSPSSRQWTRLCRCRVETFLSYI